jgi:hypothetical protein
VPRRRVGEAAGYAADGVLRILLKVLQVGLQLLGETDQVCQESGIHLLHDLGPKRLGRNPKHFNKVLGSVL